MSCDDSLPHLGGRLLWAEVRAGRAAGFASSITAHEPATDHRKGSPGSAPALDDREGRGLDVSRNSSRRALNTCCNGAAIVILAATALTGCKGDDAASAVPSGTASAPSLPPSTPDSQTRAIEDVYIKLNAFLTQADKLPADVRKQQASGYTVDPQLTRILRHAEELRSKNLTIYGTTIAHVASVTINGSDAVLRDCADSSEMGMMNTLTRKKLNRGVKSEDIKAYFQKSDGKWKVAKLVSLGKGCRR